MAGAQLILSRTRIGKSMRAVADNRRLAEVCGLQTKRVTDVTWLITGFMAGVAGVMLALQTHTFGPDMGDNYVYLIFPAVIIGGMADSNRVICIACPCAPSNGTYSKNNTSGASTSLNPRPTASFLPLPARWPRRN